MAQIELDGVSKRYGDVRAVDGIDLTIRNREFLVLLGPSGCGKTTLMRMIAGLEQVSAGEIRMGGRRVNDQPPASRDIAMVFQSYGLYPHMTVGQNIAFPLQMRRMPKALQAEKIETAAERVGVLPYLDRTPKELSGGQRQRVALARAIVREPKLFLMDEPLSNLDAQLRLSTRRQIRALTKVLGTTTIYVTHDQVEAMTLADRIVVMKAGRIQQVGRPEDIYDRPANAFVAQFIGNPPMNLLDGTVSGGVFRGENVQVEGLDVADGPVRLGFRAEDSEILMDDLGFTGCEIAAPLTDLEVLGEAVLVHVRAGGREVVARAQKGFRVATGSQVRIIVPPDICHIFHAKSGAQINGPVLMIADDRN